MDENGQRQNLLWPRPMVGVSAATDWVWTEDARANIRITDLRHDYQWRTPESFLGQLMGS